MRSTSGRAASTISAASHGVRDADSALEPGRGARLATGRRSGHRCLVSSGAAWWPCHRTPAGRRAPARLGASREHAAPLHPPAAPSSSPPSTSRHSSMNPAAPPSATALAASAVEAIMPESRIDQWTRCSTLGRKWRRPRGERRDGADRTYGSVIAGALAHRRRRAPAGERRHTRHAPTWRARLGRCARTARVVPAEPAAPRPPFGRRRGRPAAATAARASVR